MQEFNRPPKFSFTQIYRHQVNEPSQKHIQSCCIFLTQFITSKLSRLKKISKDGILMNHLYLLLESAKLE